MVDQDKLRFDFTHFSALTQEEISKVEAIVRDEIAKGLIVNTAEMTLEEAKQTGAMALFGEKYGDTVRVVKMGDFSTELCGGTHVANTSVITAFKIISEAGIAAGVRRIEALTSNAVFDYYNEIEQQLQAVAKAAKAEPSNLIKKINAYQDEIKQLASENEKLKNQLAKDSLGDVMDQVKVIEGVSFLATAIVGADMNSLRTLGDQLKEKLGQGVIVLASNQEDKVNLIAMATDDAMKNGVHAGNIIKGIAACIGGGGGGRPNMAQAGGKNAAGISEALEKAEVVMKEQILVKK